MGCTSSAVSPPRPPPKRHQRLSTSFSSSDAGDETAASSPERVVIAVPSASPLQPSPRIQADISCASCGIVFDTEEELAFHERLHLPASAAASSTSRVCSGVRPNHPRPSPGNIFESFSDFVSLLDAPQTPVLRPNAGLSPALSAMFAPSNPPSQSNPAEYESDVQGRVIDGVSAGGRGRGDSYPPARSRVRGVRLASSLTSQSFSSSPSDDDIALMFGMRSPAVVSEPSGLSLPASPSPLPAVGISRAFGLHLPISESLSSTPRARVSGGQSAHLASPPAVPAPPSADSLCDRLWPSASVPSPLFELVPSSLPSPLPPPPPPPPSNTDGCIGRAGAPIVDRSLCPASVPLPALITDQSDVPEWGPGQEDTLDDWLSDEPALLLGGAAAPTLAPSYSGPVPLASDDWEDMIFAPPHALIRSPSTLNLSDVLRSAPSTLSFGSAEGRWGDAVPGPGPFSGSGGGEVDWVPSESALDAFDAWLEGVGRSPRLFTGIAADVPESIQALWASQDPWDIVPSYALTDAIAAAEGEALQMPPACSPPSEDCAICLDTVTRPLTIPCGHSFCKLCLLRTLVVRHVCPLCRAIIMPQHVLSLPM